MSHYIFLASWFYGKTHMFHNELKIFLDKWLKCITKKLYNFSAQKILTWKGTILKFRKKTFEKYMIKNLHYNISEGLII